MKGKGLLLTAGSLLVLLTSCGKDGNNTVWNDKNSGSFRYQNAQSLWGSDEDVSARRDEPLVGPGEDDFLPLKDEDLRSVGESAVRQPKAGPGESGVPGLDRFITPSSDLAAVFRPLYFNTDEHTVHGREALEAIDRIAAYLTSHPGTYIVIEGHADERGPEAYNLALGMRRSNSVRSLLVKRGVDLEKLHTISYGKERPADSGHTAQSWAKNRRAQFKIHQK